MTRSSRPEEIVTLPPYQEDPAIDQVRSWSRDTCPNCGYARADVDPEGILWCPACGYSRKGCYT